MKHQKEQTLYERSFGNHYFLFAISACLILLLMGLLSERLEREVSHAEQAHFEHRLIELRAVVRLMEAALVSQGELSLADRFEGANPMDWLEDDTSNYLGERSPEAALAHPGNWFFDPEKREIAYIPPDIHAVKGESTHAKITEKILRFKVLALRSKEDSKKFNGLVLSPVWPDQPSH
jgi:hypothetical protein